MPAELQGKAPFSNDGRVLAGWRRHFSQCASPDARDKACDMLCDTTCDMTCDLSCDIDFARFVMFGWPPERFSTVPRVLVLICTC